MYTHQTVERDGRDLVVTCGEQREVHSFASETEAEARRLFIAEALTWVGTPFLDCGDIKGPQGGVDCAMLLVRSSVDTGLLKPFDPRPYPPRWLLHRSEERFLGWVRKKLGAVEVERPRIGDLVIWMFGRCYAHGAVLVNNEEVVHAYYAAGLCLVSRLDEDVLRYIPAGGRKLHRPVKYFDLWEGWACQHSLV